jgi:spore coat-associated protein N
VNRRQPSPTYPEWQPFTVLPRDRSDAPGEVTDPAEGDQEASGPAGGNEEASGPAGGNEEAIYAAEAGDRAGNGIASGTHVRSATPSGSRVPGKRSVATTNFRGRLQRLNHIHRHSRIVSLLAVLVIAVLGTGIGAFATFSSSSSTSASVGNGSVGVEWTSSGNTSLAVPVGPVLPGQSVHRHVELSNSGSVPVSELQLMISADETDNSDGLQLAIRDCSVPWSGTTSLTCGGIETVVSAERPLRAVIALQGLGSNEAGGGDFLRLVFRLPETAPASLQATSTTIYFEVLGNQRIGQQR